MPEKIYLSADQYVVKKLEEREQEIALLNNKYDELLGKYLKTQAENKKFETIKHLFKVEETEINEGWKIAIYDKRGDYSCTVAYCWNKENPEPEFLDLLDLLGLELPKEK